MITAHSGGVGIIIGGILIVACSLFLIIPRLKLLSNEQKELTMMGFALVVLVCTVIGAIIALLCLFVPWFDRLNFSVKIIAILIMVAICLGIKFSDS